MTTLTSPAVNPAQRSRSGLIGQTLGHPLASFHLVIAIGAVLIGFGVVMVSSASSVVAQSNYGDAYHFGKRQLLFALIGLVLAWLLSRLGSDWLRRLAWPALALAMVLLMLSILTPLGVEVSGNRNWLRFGPSWTQFQPSEFAKLALIVLGARLLADRRRDLNDMRQWFGFLAAGGLLAGLVLFQKDLGTASVIGLMVLGMAFMAGAPARLLGAVLIVVAAGVGILTRIQPNRMNRIAAWLHPSSDPLGANYQPNHGLYALASGGWWGQGLGASKQKWGLLSASHTDYILAVIGEELGLAGSLTVIFLFFALGYLGLRVALRSDDPFNRVVAVGVAVWFSVQAFINIAVVLRLSPVLGVTLPLVSYGGSSLIATTMGLGLLVGCARAEPEAQRALAERRIGSGRVTSVFSRGRQ
ncbi:MAG: putative lipid II flippase FtsW [Propionibacteriaceae bacterium]|jgi:cell division protein FtsW|nr:putative lipid II flippase FtsW [Propionibacteriaceae bacterium]